MAVHPGMIAGPGPRLTSMPPITATPVMRIRGAPGAPGPFPAVVHAAHHAERADLHLRVLGHGDLHAAHHRDGLDNGLGLGE